MPRDEGAREGKMIRTMAGAGPLALSRQPGDNIEHRFTY